VATRTRGHRHEIGRLAAARRGIFVAFLAAMMKRLVLAVFCLGVAHGSAHAAWWRSRPTPTRHTACEVVKVPRNQTSYIAVPQGKTVTLRVDDTSNPLHRYMYKWRGWYWDGRDPVAAADGAADYDLVGKGRYIMDDGPWGHKTKVIVSEWKPAQQSL
jgi:hypothetical protein